MPFILIRVAVGLEPIPADIGQEAGYRTGRQSTTGPKYRDKPLFTPMVNLESPTNLDPGFWSVGGSRRKPTKTQGEHAEHTAGPCPTGIWIKNLLAARQLHHRDAHPEYTGAFILILLTADVSTVSNRDVLNL